MQLAQRQPFGLDEQLEILLAIVVGDLLARFDRLDGAQDHLAPLERALRIRAAGVVCIAADVGAYRAVDGPAIVDLEHVAARAVFSRAWLRALECAPGIFDDERAALDRRSREQAKSGRGAADPVAGITLTGHAAARHAAASRVRITASSVATRHRIAQRVEAGAARGREQLDFFQR
jgi:hypothetical protein